MVEANAVVIRKLFSSGDSLGSQAKAIKAT